MTKKERKQIEQAVREALARKGGEGRARKLTMRLGSTSVRYAESG